MRAVIIGNNGSGKTWLVTRMATRHRASVFHMDNLFWEPGGFDKKREAPEKAIVL
jgi:adenylate kinase family enzyme